MKTLIVPIVAFKDFVETGNENILRYNNLKVNELEKNEEYMLVSEGIEKRIKVIGDPKNGFQQMCGECGSIKNDIVAQCLICGCAVCEKCKDHEQKCGNS